MPTEVPSSSDAWKIATFVLSALLTLAVAFVPMVYTPIVASSMKSIARQEIEDHREELHVAIQEKRAEQQLETRLADIVSRLERIEARLQDRRED